MAFKFSLFRKKPMEESSISVGNSAQSLDGRIYPELENSAFWGCLTKLVRTYSTLPWKIYRDGDPAEEIRGDFWVKELFKHPAPYLNSTEWRAIMAFNTELFGEAFAIITRNRNVITSLLPVSPSLMASEWDGNRLMWRYTPTGERFSDDDVLHFMPFATGYASVLNPAAYAHRDLAVVDQSKTLQTAYYKNGATIGGIFTVPKGTSKEVKEQIKAMIQGSYSGSSNSAKTMVIEDSMKYEPIHLENGDVTKLEQAATWTAKEVYSRFFGSASEATYANAEQNRQAEMFQILPRINVWESALNEILPSGIFTKFDLKNYYRADPSTQMNMVVLGVNNSLYTINEGRAFLDLPPIEGGDVMRAPLNYGVVQPDGSVLNPNQQQPGFNPFDLPASDKVDKTSKASDRLNEKRARDLSYLSETQNVSKTNRAKVESIMRKQVKDYIDKVNDLRTSGTPEGSIATEFDAYSQSGSSAYGEEYADVFKAVITKLYPIVQKQTGVTDVVIDQDILDAYAGKFGMSLAGRFAGQCAKDLKKCETDEDYEDLEDAWVEKPSTDSVEETNRAGNAFQVFMFGALGVTVMHVVAAGDSCQFCQSLDGKVVSVNGNILTKGSSTTDGAGNIRHINKNYKHPPFHTFCNCGVAPN